MTLSIKYLLLINHLNRVIKFEESLIDLLISSCSLVSDDLNYIANKSAARYGKAFNFQIVGDLSAIFKLKRGNICCSTVAQDHYSEKVNLLNMPSLSLLKNHPLVFELLL